MTEAQAVAVRLHDYHPSPGDLRSEILEGLKETPHRIPPKYFYDRDGSLLFDQITELPEYYPTRTELGIMQACIGELGRLIGPEASLIEFGSGTSLKTRILLENLPRLAAYVPVEISKKHLVEAATELATDYPDVQILPVCADFTQPFRLPTPDIAPRRNVVYFPGSTIGNFYPDQARALLRSMSRLACKGGGLLIGIDLKKDKAILERAYNDAAGITAAFNLNMLRRMNRELDANFDLQRFRHRAIYNEQFGRIEMHLISTADQTVEVAGETFELPRDDYILTECSHKYDIEQFTAMAAEAQFRPVRVWTDPQRLFSVHYLECYAPHTTCSS